MTTRFMTNPPLPSVTTKPRRIGHLGGLLAAMLMAGCAFTPKPPPECAGPWTPINAASTQAPR
jgi:hypothetical protein